MEYETFFLIGVFSFLLAALLSLLPAANRKGIIYLLPACGSVSLGAFALGHIFSGNKEAVFSTAISPSLSLNFGLDPLSGFFAVTVSILSLAVSIYSVGYSRKLNDRGVTGFLYNLFILSIYAVVTASDALTFLICWETMSVLSYFLVVIERTEKASRAGLIYAVMTHVGTAFLVALFLVLYKHTGSMDFSVLRSLSAGLPSTIKNTLFIFSLIGFGMKAGIVPLHTWLPRAHPAAPSNVSSLMSGVMIKTGIYGLLRVGVDILGQGPAWWGLTILAVGAVSSVLGMMYALMERDLKRLLAYSSVENIGIILLGIGASMIFKADGLYYLSAIAMTAGLFHTLNHALFKGLLFLGAGSVLHETGTKNMEDLGGLIKTMPYTGLFFLLGSLSICAFPPFNGFISEWLTFQSLILGYGTKSMASKILLPMGGAALALTGALAAACFVKAFGITFLGHPRSEYAASAKEAPASMNIGMALLALLCLLFGIFPSIVLNMAGPAVKILTSEAMPTSNGWFINIASSEAGFSPSGIFLAIVFMSALTYIFLRSVGGKGRITLGDSWDCGMAALTPRMQYTATAFTKPLRLIFKRIYLPRRELLVSYILKPFFVKRIEYSGEITPVFEKFLYKPFTAFLRRAAERVRVIQSGNLNLYLGYILLTLILLLIFKT